MRRGDPKCVLCGGERGWWPTRLRRCPFHPDVAAQHHVCVACAEAHGLGDDGFLWVCPKAPEVRVALALMAEEGK